MYTGPHIIKDGLVFGYDTGYGIADNSTSTRFYPGEPTTNAVPLSTFINTSNWTGVGWSGGIAVSADYDNTLELTSTNGWRTFRVDTGITSGGTVTVSYEYKMKTLATTTVFMMNLNGDHLGSYVNSLGSISAADTQDLSKWKTFTGTFTANSNSNLAIGLRGSDNAGLTDTIYVRNLQVELNSHATPYTTSSRSSTASLIDLKETTDIDVSNISFDSTGQPDFDGTSDKINLSDASHLKFAGGSFTVEQILVVDSISSKQRTFSKGSSGWSRGWHAAIRPTQWEFELSDGVSSPGNSFKINTATTVGTNHVVWAIEGGATAKLYINGVQAGSTQTITEGIDFATTTSAVGIGAWENGAEYFNGKIPVTRIYNKALSATEIKQNYNAYKNRFDI